jgi:hypothetical protein
MRRWVSFLLVAIIIIGGAFLVYRFVRNLDDSKVKTVVVKENGEFEPDKLNLANDEFLRIKNDDAVKHTVKNEETKQDVAVLEPGQTSDKIDFTDNSSNQLYLADKSEEKFSILVGLATEPEQEASTETPTPAQTPTPTTPAQEPGALPNTGVETYLFLVMILAGFILVKVSSEIVRKA